MFQDFDTEKYCSSLGNLNKVQAIRAIHFALCQLQGLDANVDCGHYWNKPVIEALEDCLREAGHIAFRKENDE